MSNPNLIEVRIKNSDNNTEYYLYIRKDRLKAFYDFLVDNRRPDTPPSAMPGLTWSAMLGLDAIFDRRPRSFPTIDIVNFLVNDFHQHPSCPAVTPAEIENALERFSTVFPPDAAAGAA